MTTLGKLNLIMGIANEVTTTLETEINNCDSKDIEIRIRNAFKEMAKKRYLDRLLGSLAIPSKPISKITTSKGIKIYCDGGCSSLGAGSGVIVYIDDKKPLKYYGGYNPSGTNNTAELTALKEAIVKAIDLHTDKVIDIMSDSRYSIDSITNWSYSWKRNGWTKRKGLIKNVELIKEIHELYHTNKEKIRISWVKGHSKIEGNELADAMAGLAIKKKQTSFILSK